MRLKWSMSRKISDSGVVVPERVLELALDAIGEVALVVRVGEPVAQRRLRHLPLKRLVQLVLVGELRRIVVEPSRILSPSSRAVASPPACRCSTCRWSSPRSSSTILPLLDRMRACSREMPSSMRRTSALSPRPMTDPVLVELVHLADVATRPAPSGTAAASSARSCDGVCAVRVVSSSGSATRSRVMPHFTERPGHLANGRFGGPLGAMTPRPSPVDASRGILRARRRYSGRLPCRSSIGHQRVYLSQPGGGASIPRSSRRAKMLAYYAERLGAVEINNTFYRMPKPETARALGRRDTAPTFRFALKAPQPITHTRSWSTSSSGHRAPATRRRDARRRAGADPVSAPAVPAQGCGAAGGISWPTWPPPRLARRRSNSATTPGSPTTSTPACACTTPRCASRRRRTWRRPWWRPRAGATCACAARTTTRRRSPRGPNACKAQSWETAYVFFKHEDEEGRDRPLPPASRSMMIEPLSGILRLLIPPWDTVPYTSWRERSAGATISFGLVSIPVKLYAATQASAGVSFNLLHASAASRLKQQYICPRRQRDRRAATTWSRATSSRRTST